MMSDEDLQTEIRVLTGQIDQWSKSVRIWEGKSSTSRQRHGINLPQMQRHLRAKTRRLKKFKKRHPEFFI